MVRKEEHTNTQTKWRISEIEVCLNYQPVRPSAELGATTCKIPEELFILPASSASFLYKVVAKSKQWPLLFVFRSVCLS